MMENFKNWLHYKKHSLAWSWECFVFWYSPPWRKTRRCPACAGSGSKAKYDFEQECCVCHGDKVIPKWVETETFLGKLFRIMHLQK